MVAISYPPPHIVALIALADALLAQASTEVQISIKLLIAYDSALALMGVARSKNLGSQIFGATQIPPPPPRKTTTHPVSFGPGC